MATVRQITYDVPSQIKDQANMSGLDIEVGELSWGNLGVYFGNFLMIGLPLALAGIVVDLVGSRSSENLSYGTTVTLVSTLFFVLLVLIFGRAIRARKAHDRLFRLTDELSYELDEWLMDNHQIFLDDDILEEISEAFLNSIESVQFTHEGKVYDISQKIDEQPKQFHKSSTPASSDVTSAGPDLLVEKVRRIWVPEVNNAYERVNKTIEDLENMEEGALSVEEQHVVTRAYLNLNDIMQLTVNLSRFDKIKDEDTQKIMNMLFVMNDELTRIHLNRADAVRKELNVLPTVIVERRDLSTNAITLSSEE